MGEANLIALEESVARCPVCARYLVRLAAAVNDPVRNPAPSTRKQVRHEAEEHGGYVRYYREINDGLV